MNIFINKYKYNQFFYVHNYINKCIYINDIRYIYI